MGQPAAVLVPLGIRHSRGDELVHVVEDLVLGEVRRSVPQREVGVIVDDGEPVDGDALVIADPRREELVVHRGVRQLTDEPSCVDQPAADVGIVTVEEDVLVEPAGLDEAVASVDLVRALQVRELERAWVALAGELVLTLHGATESICGAVAVLQRHSRVVEDDATHPGDLWILEGRQRLSQPLRLGKRVVVDEGDQLARARANPDVAGDRQVPFGVVEVADPVPPRLEDLERCVRGRPVHHDDLEVVVVLVTQAVEGGT